MILTDPEIFASTVNKTFITKCFKNLFRYTASLKNHEAFYSSFCQMLMIFWGPELEQRFKFEKKIFYHISWQFLTV